MENLKNIKIGVLGGGVSAEREISLISAREVFKVLEKNKLAVVFIDVFSSQKEKVKEMILSEAIDLAFIALHGEFGEDGQIQRILQELDIAYTGSGVKASWQAMNKICAKNIFLEKNVPTPAFWVWQDNKSLPENVNYPLVVKPYLSGSSLGVSIVRGREELDAAVDHALLMQNEVILEEYIAGREVTVGILEEKALGVVEIIPQGAFFDFDNKYSGNMAELRYPVDLDKELYIKIQQTGLIAHEALGCRHFSRVDIRLSREGIPYVLEVNSIPGLTPKSLLPLSAKFCGIEFEELILRMARVSLNEKIYTKRV